MDQNTFASTASTPEHKDVAVIEGLLYFNAGVIAREKGGLLQIRIVRDRTPDGKAELIKIPGGMMENCDLNDDCWLNEIERQMVIAKFNKNQIEEILIRERSLVKNHDFAKRGIIREMLEEAGIYAKEARIFHTFDQPSNPEKKKDAVRYNFFLVEEFIVPAGNVGPFISSDKDVVGGFWAHEEELFPKSAVGNKNIIPYTHKQGMGEFLTKYFGNFSKELSVYEM